MHLLSKLSRNDSRIKLLFWTWIFISFFIWKLNGSSSILHGLFYPCFLLISITLSFLENRFFLSINSSFSKAMRKFSQKQINSSFSFSIFIDNQLMKTKQILTWLFESFVVWFERRTCHYLWSSVRILVLGRVDADLFPYLMEPCIYFLKEHQAKRRTFLVYQYVRIFLQHFQIEITVR